MYVFLSLIIYVFWSVNIYLQIHWRNNFTFARTRYEFVFNLIVSMSFRFHFDGIQID